MSLEKLGVLFLLNYFNQLSTVKNHVLNAVKEILLAIQSSVDILSQSTSKSLLGNRVDFLNPMISQINRVLDYTIERITPDQVVSPGEETGQRIKDHIVGSIISAIDDEIENTRNLASEKNKLKVEALYTVKQVLMTQKKKGFSTDSKSIRRSA